MLEQNNVFQYVFTIFLIYKCYRTGNVGNSSKAWKYFSRDVSGKQAVCKLCSKAYKTCVNTKNMLDHLRCCHKEEYFQSTTSDSSDSEKQDGNADPKSKRTKEPNKKQLTIRTLLKRKNPTPIRKITQKSKKQINNWFKWL